jgi:hypothetical protein
MYSNADLTPAGLVNKYLTANEPASLSIGMNTIASIIYG